MRSVGLSDLDIATRALLAVPRAGWPTIAASLIEDAHTSDLWRKRRGCPHPDGGTGSLYAQASLYPRVATSQSSARYCAAMGVLLHALEAWRSRLHSEM
ncbi:MAG: hypothetical protein KIH44_013455 [Octadecabacter sp.]|nr:hypothetical protein [Octadecabacter sp.]